MRHSTGILVDAETEFIVDDDFGLGTLVIRQKGDSPLQGVRVDFLSEAKLDELAYVVSQLQQVRHDNRKQAENEVFDRLDRGAA